MRRFWILAVGVAALLLLPSAAGAASWRGTVVAKDRARDAVVTASRGGVVRTVRAPARVKQLRLGQRVAVRAGALADGTFAARRVRVLGRASKARVRAVVVRSQAARVLVSAGGSVFAIRSSAARALSGAGAGLEPGDGLIARLHVKQGKLWARTIVETAHADLVELEGIHLSLADGLLELAVAHRGRVEVVVPPELVLPELSPGDEIELVARVGEDGSFTLVSVQDGDHDSVEHHGVHFDDDGDIEARGILRESTATSVTVEPGGTASAVTCVHDAGIVLPGFALDAEVEIECRLDEGGELVLRKIEVETEQGELEAKVRHGGLAYEVEGLLESLEPPTVSAGVGADPVACLLPDGVVLDGFSVGDRVELECALDG
ncbi:MAG: hypothetical protein ACE5EV_01295, partial [Gaiellales bacterium]